MPKPRTALRNRNKPAGCRYRTRSASRSMRIHHHHSSSNRIAHPTRPGRFRRGAALGLNVVSMGDALTHARTLAAMRVMRNMSKLAQAGDSSTTPGLGLGACLATASPCCRRAARQCRCRERARDKRGVAPDQHHRAAQRRPARKRREILPLPSPPAIRITAPARGEFGEAIQRCDRGATLVPWSVVIGTPSNSATFSSRAQAFEIAQRRQHGA